MLATPANVPFSAQGWIFELKYDGFRVLASKRGKRVRLESRNGRDMTAAFPELVAAMRTIQRDLVIDGELVICDERGCPQFARLGQRARLRRPDRIDEAAAKNPAAIFAFDLLELDGEDYRGYPLVIRKGMLQHALSGSGRIIYAGHFENSAAELWALAKKFELEGIVAKDGSAAYAAGRSTRWQKIKTKLGAEREKKRRPAAGRKQTA
ncbi:MAG: ligase [Betaproteobacteria bacterium]|nr:ligase [Betaproteobacteria bacterium]